MVRLTYVKGKIVGPGGCGNTPRGRGQHLLGGTDVADGSAHFGAPGDSPYGFAEALGEWLHEHDGLVEALRVLRDLGEDASDAVAAVLSLRPVRVMAQSWALWEPLVDARDVAVPLSHLLRVLPGDVVESVSYALWGNDHRALKLVELRRGSTG